MLCRQHDRHTPAKGMRHNIRFFNACGTHPFRGSLGKIAHIPGRGGLSALPMPRKIQRAYARMSLQIAHERFPTIDAAAPTV